MFMNLGHIPFTRAIRNITPSRWHLRLSCPPLFSFPLFHAINFFTAFHPQCGLNSQKIGVLLAIHNPILWGLAGVMFTGPSWFWERRARATQMPSGGRKYTWVRTANLYTSFAFPARINEQKKNPCRKNWKLLIIAISSEFCIVIFVRSFSNKSLIEVNVV